MMCWRWNLGVDLHSWQGGWQWWGLGNWLEWWWFRGHMVGWGLLQTRIGVGECHGAGNDPAVAAIGGPMAAFLVMGCGSIFNYVVEAS